MRAAVDHLLDLGLVAVDAPGDRARITAQPTEGAA